MNVRNIAALLALSALPACSMFGGGSSNRQASAPAPQSYAAQSPQPNYSSAPQSQELSQDTIRQVQTKLQQAGMYRGHVDGVWGPQTEAAVRQYQQQHNMNASGQLDPDTLSALNIGSNQNYGSNNSSSYNNGNNNPGNNSANNNNNGTNNASNYNPPANANAPSANANMANQNGSNNTQR